MRHRSRICRSGRDRREGTALAIAMLVVVMLSAIGTIALNASSYDVASSGALRTGAHARTVSEGGLGLCRTQMCRSIDGVTVSMRSVRENQGRAPEFIYRTEELESGLETDHDFFDAPSSDGRGSFGYVGSVPPMTQVNVRIDRPRESGEVSGYAMREGSGSDSGSLCFRSFRVTSTGTFGPPGSTTLGTSQAVHRAYITAGPIDCSM